MNRVKYKYLPHQIKALKSKKKIIFDGCGIGSGKTDIGCVWTSGKIRNMGPDQIGLIGANSYTQLFDATLRKVFANFRKWGIPFRPQSLPRSRSPINLEIHNGSHWVEILCRSLDNYEMLSGTEIAFAWLDETWQTKADALDVVFGRLRGGDKDQLQMLMTTTLDDPDSDMYKMVVDDFDPEEMEVIYATTYQNEHNLPKGYIKTLKKRYSPQLFDRMVLTKWVSLMTGLIYTNFDRNLHVGKDAEFDPALPVCWSHDFNIGQDKPMSSCLAQIKKNDLHIFDEIILESSDTNDAVSEFKNRSIAEKANDVIVYGDAAGRAKDTRSKTTDYRILFSGGFRKQKVPKANPSIRDRHNAVNSLLKNADGDVRLRIHPRCKTLIKGLETVKLKKGSGYLEEETWNQHVTTALGYLVAKEFSLKPKFKRRGARSY